MRCRSALTRIDAMRTGELPAQESTAVHQHLKKCRSCDESVTDLSALTSTIKELVVPSPRSLKSTCTDHFDVIDADGEQVVVAFSDRGLRMIKIGASVDESELVRIRTRTLRSRSCPSAERARAPGTK